MLGKLLKYDFRSMWKQFSIIWPAALVLAFINRFTMFGMGHPGGSVVGEWTAIVTMTLFVGVCIAMAIVSAVFVLTRFYKGLLGAEGYLMNTLPVQSWQLVLSKLVCALVTTVVNGVVGVLALFLMMPIDWRDLFDTELWATLFRGLFQQPDVLLYLLELLLVMAAGAVLAITVLYLSMAIGHLFSKHRIVMSVVAYFGLQILGTTAIGVLGEMGLLDHFVATAASGTHSALWMAIVLQLLPAALAFWATSWILGHKLDLE